MYVCVGERQREKQTEISVIITFTFLILNIYRNLSIIWLKRTVTGKAWYSY